MKRKLYSILFICFVAYALPSFADNDTIKVDFVNGFDTTWVKKSSKRGNNLIYADCGIVNDVMRDGVSAYWYSAQRLETHFKIGDNVDESDTIQAFGAFDYDEAKIKKKLGSEYSWFVESYGDKDLIVRLGMFVKNDHGRLLIFKSGLLPTSLTHEKPLEVYWDKVHTTMGVSQTYRIEPKEVPDSLQIQITSGSSVYVTVEALYDDVFVPLVEDVVATLSQPFGLNLKDVKVDQCPIYITVRRGVAANVSKLKIMALEAKEPDLVYDTTYVNVDTIACAGSEIMIEGKSYNRNTTVYVYGIPQPTAQGYHVDAIAYNLIFEPTPRVLDTVFVRSFPYTTGNGTVVTQQGWKHVSVPADNVCGSITYSTYYYLDPNATGNDTVYYKLDTTLCEGSVFEYEGLKYTESQTIVSTNSVNVGSIVRVIINTINLKFFETPRTVAPTVYVTSWPYVVDGKVVAARQGWVNDTVPADNPCGMEIVSTYYTLASSEYDSEVKLDPREETVTLCQGSSYELEGQVYTKSQNVVIVEREVTDRVLYTTEVTYHLVFVQAPRTIADTVFVQSWPYTNGKLVVEGQGWLNDTIADDGVCGYSIVSTYYANAPITNYKYVFSRISVDTVLCQGTAFEFEGQEYTEPQVVQSEQRVYSRDTAYVNFYTYRLSFIEQPYVYDTVLVNSFPAQYDGITATKEGEYVKPVAADNPCGQVLYAYYFAIPVPDTVQRIEIDTLSCLGSVVEIAGQYYTTDTTFTLYTSVPNGLVLEVSAITYSIEFEEPVETFDTVYVSSFPANVDGRRVEQEGWLRIETPVQSPCLIEVTNHYVVVDESIQWGKTCEDAIYFQYGYDQWFSDTLWFAVSVPELIDNGIAAYWNPLDVADSLEISVFLDCETKPLETKVIAYDRFYHISPQEIQNRYLSILEEKGIDINKVKMIGVRFVARGTGELIVLKSGQHSDHYVINETHITDTVCEGKSYVIDGIPYRESVSVTLSTRNVGVITTVITTVYNIIFVPTTIVYDTVWIDQVPYVSEKGFTITHSGQSVVEWLKDDSPCGEYQVRTSYILPNALGMNEMSVSVRPTLADAGQNIFIDAQGNNSLQVFDISGREILRQQFIDNTAISLSNKGEYIIRIMNNDAVGIQKIIIK